MNIREIIKLLKEEDNFPESCFQEEITFIQFYNACKKRRFLKDNEVWKKTNLERSYFYQITKGRKNPGKDKVIQISIALDLELEETNILLTLSDNAVLSPYNNQDLIIIFGICHHYPIKQINDLLSYYHYEILK